MTTSDCHSFRRQLMATDEGVRQQPSSRHPMQCQDCTEFVIRWRELTSELDDDQVVSPPAGFTASVRARIPNPPNPLLIFAWRTVPLTMAMVVVLAAWLLTQGAFQQSNYNDPVDASVAWVLEGAASE